MRRILMTGFVMLLLFGSGVAHAQLEDLDIHGFASTGYLKSTENNFLVLSEEGSFEFNEAGLNVTTSLTDNVRVGLQLFARDQGDIGNNAVKLDWAFLDYQWKDALGVRLGKLKTPLGLYNDTRDYDLLRTSILLPSSVYSENARESAASYRGGGLYGALSLGLGGRLRYDIFGGGMEISTDGSVAKALEGKGDSKMTLTSARAEPLVGGRIRWQTPLPGLMLGATLYQSDLTYTTQLVSRPIDLTIEVPESRVGILSATYSLGDLTAAAEYQRTKFDTTTTMDMSRLGQPNPKPVEATRDIEAYYGLLTYRLTNWFEAGVYYSVYYSDRDDREGDNQVAAGKPDYAAWQKDLALSTRFDLTDFWLVKLEVHFMDGVAQCVGVDNPDDFDAQHWTLFAVKTTFNF